MCSESFGPTPAGRAVTAPRRAGRGALAALLALATLATLATACGRKGDPLPPPNMAPAASRDLAVAQRGNEIRLLFAYPATAVSGLALPGVEAVEVWAMTRPLEAAEEEGAADDDGEAVMPEADATIPPAGASPPPVGEEVEAAAAAATDSGTGPTLLPVWPMTALPPAVLREVEEALRPEPFDPASLARLVLVGRFALMILPPPEEGPPPVAAQEFEAAATLLATLEGPELERVVAGDRIEIALPLPDPPPAGAQLHAYAVATVSSEGRTSPRSPIVTIVPAATPPPPIGIETQPVEDGVAVTWVARDVGIEGFNIDRRDPESRSWGPPLITRPPDARFYKDTTAAYGQRYVYTVTAVAETDPLMESAVGGEREVDYQDRYPPPVPTRVVALPEERRVRLLWDASDAPDTAGYLVFRDAGEGFERITPEPVPDPEYTDAEVASGRSYAYEVAAVDELGNVSARSATVETSPR